MNQLITTPVLPSVLLLDPPWMFKSAHTGGSMKSGSVDHYPVMPLDEIKSLKIPTAKDSVLFLWATVPMLPEALEVMKALGYSYKTAVFWHKTGRNGLGYWFRGEVEILLFGVKGKVKAFRCQLPNHVEAPVGKHSEKPEIFREIIEKATASMNPRYLELFARKQTPNWVSVGYDIDGKDIRQALAELESEP